MPLTRPAVALSPGPRAAQEGRHWVVNACAEVGRSDLTETAELCLTEVITNAVLHGRDPIRVQMRGTVEHPRIEVHDGSYDAPMPPPDTAPDDVEALMVTFGRGLSIVARCCDAWGADRTDDGKTVWFAPSPEPPEQPRPGMFTGWVSEPLPRPRRVGHRFDIALLRVPSRTLLATQRHISELRRELRLLALAHQDSYPVARDLSEFFSLLDRDFRSQLVNEDVHNAVGAGVDRIDLQVSAPPDARMRFRRLLDLLDLADAFCRDERLLTLARTPEQVTFQRWFFGEFVRQSGGETPTPWTAVPDRRAEGVC